MQVEALEFLKRFTRLLDFQTFFWNVPVISLCETTGSEQPIYQLLMNTATHFPDKRALKRDSIHIYSSPINACSPKFHFMSYT